MKMIRIRKFISGLFSRRAFKVYLLLALLGYFLFEMLLLWGTSTYKYDAEPLLSRKPSTLYYDSRGNVIWAEMGEGDVWQIPVKYQDISPNIVKAILSAEDKRFWQHGGVDYLRMCRAALSNLTGGRIVSGASTISMQVVRVTTPEERSWGFKARQVFMALHMEENYSKKWIITQYLNNASFGSNLIGVEAASLYYFGKPCRVLSMEEATLLASLPQRPSFLRPDRFPERALKRQQWVLAQVRKNFPDQDCNRPATYHRQVFSPPGPTGKLGHELKEPHYISLLPEKGQGGKVTTTLDPLLQDLALQSLKNQLKKYPDVNDGAAVILDNKSGALRALVGTIDFNSPDAGQVNAATALRSPGSALKPFIYLNAIEQGMIIPETILNDSPILGKYQPGNFDGLYRGKVNATQALSTSLNTPAVRLLHETGVACNLDQLRQFGISSLQKSASHYGLSLALGGGEVSLLELTNAYATLARKGLFRPVSLVPGQNQQEVSTVNPGSVELLTEMLCSRKLLQQSSTQIAWKTGTSNGLRDAWCIGYTTDYTVGIWLGNKGGQASKHLVGAKSAAPIVASIFEKIHNGRVIEFPEPLHLEPVEVTEVSGLRAKASHRNRQSAFKVKAIPLRFCQSQADEPATVSPKIVVHITSPRVATYFAVEDDVKLNLASDFKGSLHWFINGELIGTSDKTISHLFKRGSYRIVCMTKDGSYSDSLNFEVK